ncbi:MAG: hypothetical protein IPM51_06490 [Sphingobacteriaceae bacterium]|nr:hypothetical protein [Sphingobacteriaceae bacterium]
MNSKTASFKILNDSILEVTLLENDELIDLEEAKAQFNEITTLTDGKPMAVLLDASKSLHQITPQAKKFLAENDKKLAEAIVVKALHQRIIATFYINLVSKKQKHPTKIFSNRVEALAWLKERLKND